MANEAAWAARLARYKGPELKRSVWQLASAAALFAGAWALMYQSLRVGYWLTLLLAVPAAFFLIRLFIIQHDCGHAAFFRSTRAADVVGSILGVLTLTPYHYWKKTHALHHATSGNLEHRGFGDIDTLTVDEYLARSRWERFKYRVYRHPVVLFGVGAVLHFFVRHRIPSIVPRDWTRERRSIFWTDVGLAAAIALMGTLVGFREFALVQLPVTLLSTPSDVDRSVTGSCTSANSRNPTSVPISAIAAASPTSVQKMLRRSRVQSRGTMLGIRCRTKKCSTAPTPNSTTGWRYTRYLNRSQRDRARYSSTVSVSMSPNPRCSRLPEVAWWSAWVFFQ